ncbi:phosphatase PAP2 family protein [Streptomyces sp. TS71-3]|uniref:phosphatase PAP2 family protein n=1 Tax=Streptomyces sp. TS71-3 TaxID=2733862 RepID=UPI002018348E|nr:phosphatase PAP2 family protein [Streptomyces sp. TS71-3]
MATLVTGDAARTAVCRQVARARPPATEQLTTTHGASFPSRHTATALLAFGLTTASGKRAVAEGIAAAVGVSRIALRAHWPTDVVGGGLLGFGWLAAAEFLAARARGGRRPRFVGRGDRPCPRHAPCPPRGNRSTPPGRNIHKVPGSSRAHQSGRIII